MTATGESSEESIVNERGERPVASRESMAYRNLEGTVTYLATPLFAYLGYVLFLLIHFVLSQVVLLPLLGRPLEDWYFSPMFVFAMSGAPPEQPWLLAVSTVLPWLVDLLFFFLLLHRARQGPFAVRVTSVFAASWLCIFQFLYAVLYGWRAVGPLASATSLLRLPYGRGARLLFASFVGLVTLVGIILAILPLLDKARRDSRLRRFGKLLVRFALPCALVVLAVVSTTIRFGSRFFWSLLAAGVLSPLLAALLASLGPRTSSPLPKPSFQQILAGFLVAGSFVTAAQMQSRFRVEWQKFRDDAISTRYYHFYYDAAHFRRQDVLELANAHEARLRAILNRVRLNPTAPLTVFLYPGFPERIRTVGGREQVAFGPDAKSLHVVLDSQFTDFPLWADIELALRSLWGDPGSHETARAVAIALVGEWHGQPLPQAAAKIVAEEQAYPLARVLDGTRDESLSPLVRCPLAASWFAHLAQAAGLGALKEIYLARERPSLAAARILHTSLSALEAEWAASFANAAVSSTFTPTPAARLRFFRGVSFSHEVGIGRGYLSHAAEQQIAYLHDLGANSLALVPYAFAESANSDGKLHTDTDETDESIEKAARIAHRLGMQVMLKPQIWVGRGIFTGHIRFPNPAQGAAWFSEYRQWILHYARLAEGNGIDLLCIGAELEGLTTDAGTWRALITDVRRIYRGSLTYAANWGTEFESIPFWDALDFMGLNNYYPLVDPAQANGKEVSPSLDALTAGAERLASRLEAVQKRWQKPLLFTEIGFPNVVGTGTQPWEETSDRPRAPQEQADCYEAIFRVFYKRPWFAGMFWWKWPSDGRSGGLADGSYTPAGKPAEQILRKWYSSDARN